MVPFFKDEKLFLTLTGISILSLIALILFFYMPNIHYAIIPYVWRGWFLPIEGISILLAFTGIITVVGVSHIILGRNQTSTLLKSLTDYWWIGMRIYLGFSWITSSITVLTPLFRTYDLPQLMNYIIAEGLFPSYNSAIGNLILSNAQLFGNLLLSIQLFVGISLMLGILTNLGSAIGVFLNINFLIAISWADPTGTVAAQNIFLIINQIIFILLSVGRNFGIDEILVKEFPGKILW